MRRVVQTQFQNQELLLRVPLEEEEEEEEEEEKEEEDEEEEPMSFVRTSSGSDALLRSA